MQKIAAVCLVLSAMTACSHGIMRGTVAMKVDEREAHVCLGSNEVKVGDRVALIRNKCFPTGAEDDRNYCEKEKVGEGEIIKLLNEHYSVMKVDEGISFQEGAIIEKL